MRRLVHATSFLLLLGLVGPATATPQPGGPGGPDGPDARSGRELVSTRLGASAEPTFSRDGQRLTALTKLRAPTTGDSPRARAAHFVKTHRELWSLDPNDTVDSVEAVDVKALPRLSRGDQTTQAQAESLPSQVVRLRQTHRGLPVEGREVVVTLDGADRVMAVRSDLGPLEVPMPRRELSAEEAIAAVYETFAISAHGKPEKVIIANGSAGRIAWRVPVSVLPMSGFATVWVDAEDGRILREHGVGHHHGELLRHEKETP